MHTDLIYDCQSKSECQPKEYTFNPGFYKVELWGGQGGNISGKVEGGHGGYSMCIIRLLHRQKMYFFIGAGGIEAKSGPTQSAFNGGGSGTAVSQISYASSGGGGTDLRTDFSLESRILVAGGGSGATSYSSNSFNHKGACGGGISGENGVDAPDYTGPYSKGYGGTQKNGGQSAIEPGEFGYGGNQTDITLFGSGGGGGWYGGGSGRSHGATGGGGSGYASTRLVHSMLYSGCSMIPSFYVPGTSVEGQIGNGAARVTFISNQLLLCTKYPQLLHCSTLVTFLFIVFS